MKWRLWWHELTWVADMGDNLAGRDEKIRKVAKQIARAGTGTVAEPQPGEDGNLVAVAEAFVRRAIQKADSSTTTLFNTRVYASAGLTGLDVHTDITRIFLIGTLSYSSRGPGMPVEIRFQRIISEARNAGP